MRGVERPLSPHLQVYRWGITMWLSSLHRICGLLLSAGAVVLAVWLIALASGPDSYEGRQGRRLVQVAARRLDVLLLFSPRERRAPSRLGRRRGLRSRGDQDDRLDSGRRDGSRHGRIRVARDPLEVV